jgi:hypothetical protein
MSLTPTPNDMFVCAFGEVCFAEELERKRNCNLPLEVHFYRTGSLRLTGNRILHRGESFEQGGGY